MSDRFKFTLLLVIIAIVLVVTWLLPPLTQNPQYHKFADQQTIAGIPYLWNVVSNIPLLLVGLSGLLLVKPALVGAHQHSVRFLFLGFILAGLGSSYYHLSPSNETLVWDRVPMSITFMAFFALVISLHISQRLASRLLGPLMVVGVASVFYWFYTDDLRFYAVVQFLPLLLTPLMIVMFPRAVYQVRYIWLALAFYAMAKLAEHFDYSIYSLLGFGGHALKHVFAAVAGLILLRMMLLSDLCARDQ